MVMVIVSVAEPDLRVAALVVNRHRCSCKFRSVPRHLLSLCKSGEGIKGFVFACRRLCAHDPLIPAIFDRGRIRWRTQERRAAAARRCFGQQAVKPARRSLRPVAGQRRARPIRGRASLACQCQSRSGRRIKSGDRMLPRAGQPRTRGIGGGGGGGGAAAIGGGGGGGFDAHPAASRVAGITTASSAALRNRLSEVICSSRLYIRTSRGGDFTSNARRLTDKKHNRRRPARVPGRWQKGTAAAHNRLPAQAQPQSFRIARSGEAIRFHPAASRPEASWLASDRPSSARSRSSRPVRPPSRPFARPTRSRPSPWCRHRPPHW